MNKVLAVFLLLIPVLGAQTPEPKYEMDRYVFGLIRKGPKWTAGSTPETQKIQEGHMANIHKMASTGLLIVAGPMMDNGDLRGIFIFKQAPLEQLQGMVDADPAVQAGRLIVELHPWFAAKGIKVDPPK